MQQLGSGIAVAIASSYSSNLTPSLKRPKKKKKKKALGWILSVELGLLTPAPEKEHTQMHVPECLKQEGEKRQNT